METPAYLPMERRLLESSGVRVSDGPSPVIKKALPVSDAKPKHAIIGLDHVTHRYGQGGNASSALDDVSLDIEQGAFVGLVGNGSGKTTLAKHLNGLIQPTQGIVNVDGLDVSKHSVGEMAAHVRIRIPKSRPSDFLLQHQGSRVRPDRART